MAPSDVQVAVHAKSQVVQCFQIHRIVDQHLELAAFAAKGQDHVLFDQIHRQEVELILVDGVRFVQINVFQSELAGQCLCDVCGGGVLQINENLANAVLATCGDF